jgi:hypothetical protein
MNSYQNNAFRILGLMPNIDGKGILARANEIKVKSSVGMDVSYDYDFSWMGPVDRSEENVNNAVQRLENPVSRLREEISWFWFNTDKDKEAIALLIKGDKQGANNCWKADNISARHNRFILVHSIVIGLESTIVYNTADKVIKCSACDYEYTNENYVYCIKCGGELVSVSKDGFKRLSDNHWKNWDFAIDQMLSLNKSDDFWSTLHDRARSIADARLNNAKVDAIREKFVADFLGINFSLIKSSLISKDYKRVKAHSDLLSKRDFSVEILRDGFNDILKARNSQIQDAASKYAKFLQEGNLSTPKDIYSLSNQLLKETADALYECDLIDKKSISEIGLAKDQLAQTIRNISIALNKTPFNDDAHALLVINKALNIASSDYIKQGFEKDKEVYKKNLLYHSTDKEQEKIVGPIMKDIENGKSDKALNALNEHINNYDISESTRNSLKEIKETLEKRIATQGKPIKDAPRLHATNGFGSTIYGDTLYVVCLMIPVVPIRRYSLELVGPNSYRFFGELKLHPWQKVWQWVMALLSTWIVAKSVSL